MNAKRLLPNILFTDLLFVALPIINLFIIMQRLHQTASNRIYVCLFFVPILSLFLAPMLLTSCQSCNKEVFTGNDISIGFFRKAKKTKLDTSFVKIRERSMPADSLVTLPTEASNSLLLPLSPLSDTSLYEFTGANGRKAFLCVAYRRKIGVQPPDCGMSENFENLYIVTEQTTFDSVALKDTFIEPKSDESANINVEIYF